MESKKSANHPLSSPTTLFTHKRKMPGCSNPEAYGAPDIGADTLRDNNKLVVYGASWCRYTNKMVKELNEHKELLKDNDIVVEYHDCAGVDNSCNVISSYPTLVFCGKHHAGYKAVSDVVSMMRQCASDNA